VKSRALLLCGLAVAGCHLGPADQADRPAVPAAYQAAAAGQGGSGTVAAAWWRAFGSAELDGLMADAEAGSFDILAAIARVREADAQLRAAGGALLPEIDGAARQGWTRASAVGATLVALPGGGFAVGSTTITSESRSYSLGPSISYELDLWGAVAAARDAAAASALFSRYDRETVRLTVLTSVASAWFNALAFADRLRVAERNLRDAEAILAAIKARQDVGTASLLDVSQQEALVSGIRASMPSLRQQRDQQVTALAVLVGRLPERISAPGGTLDTLQLPEVSPGLPSTLLARRPDVASAEANLIAQNANIRAARAAFFPTVSLTGSAGWQSAALGSLIGPGSVLLTAATSATQVIFDNGRLGAQYAQNRARHDELLADYRKAVVQAFVDVENGLEGLRETTEQERLEREAVTTAQRAADIARAQVEAGTLDIVTALQTQTTLFTDLDLLAQARVARFQAVVSLYKALGGGWTRDDVIAPATPMFNGAL
jgi:NodT family efflux transporter outer membrane factor (OMF) lipoprotein